MVQNFEIPLPPMNEQREIVRQIQKEVAPIMELDEKITECMRLADEERRALITAAVTGQIDVFET
jgi:type I restriction enzyme S subunit